MNQLNETLESLKGKDISPYTSFGGWGEDHFKCKKFGCNNQRSGKFPCCSMTHGVQYREHKRWLHDYQNILGYNFKDYYDMAHWPLEKVMYYADELS